MEEDVITLALADKAYTTFYSSINRKEIREFSSLPDDVKNAWINVVREIILSYPVLEARKNE